MLGGSVPFKNGRAQGGKPLGDGRMLKVGARNLVAEIQQYLGNPAHADAADADEVNALNLGEHES